MLFFFSNALHHHQQADYIPHEYSLSLSLSMVVDDDIEQVPLLQSTEWHHSIIDWVSRES